MTSSNYVEEQRRDYSLYVLKHRAIPSIADGLKSGARRILWTARNGQKYKSATLAGATMSIHPHAPPEGAINTLTAQYGNNIPLLDSSCVFGTLLKPSVFGASRYTHVKVAEFTKDVLFADLELVPMIDNYDSTEKEPSHFLPLIPIALLNPSEGVAVGFASHILPRRLSDIIKNQIAFLQGKKTKSIDPFFEPINATPYKREGNKAFFRGKIECAGSARVRVTALPYRLTHADFISSLLDMCEEEKVITDFIDNSTNEVNIEIQCIDPFTPASFYLVEPHLIKVLKLETSITENITLVDFNGDSVLAGLADDEVVRRFTTWRLGWYEKRYQRLLEQTKAHIQKLRDVLLAIEKNVGKVAVKTKTRAELDSYLSTIGIINIDYIANLPVYRFTEEEKKKTAGLLITALESEKLYISILADKNERVKRYIDELSTIRAKYA